MSEVVLIYQPYVPATLVVARRVAEYLAQQGRAHALCAAPELVGRSTQGVGLAVCFGGDGTALRAARWLGEVAAPVVPVRMGKLSFLGELSPDELPSGLEPYLSGDFWRDERAMLSVTHDGRRWTALNDAVMVRGPSPRAIHVEVLVDGAGVVTYLADGVIVSTATGSTAYSLAAGGPVLGPQMRAMVVTPIAPHLAALKSLVLPDSARVALINRGYAETVLTVDGQADISIEPGGVVEAAMASETGLFARRGERSAFYQNLSAKLTRG